MNLQMDEKHYNILLSIVKKYPYNFYAFGSRVVGNPKRLSDLDLCISENIPDNVQAHIEEDFEESDLPYKVDIIQLNKISKSFRDLIEKDLTYIQTSSHQS